MNGNSFQWMYIVHMSQLKQSSRAAKTEQLKANYWKCNGTKEQKTTDKFKYGWLA